MKDHFNFFFFKSIKNTNDELKKNYLKDKSNIAIFTQNQISGRGRVGRKWISSKGDLTCSFLINTQVSPKRLGQINIWFINILYEILKKIYPTLDLKIKWPNDLYLNDSKLGGVLMETSIKNNTSSYILIGVGINLISSPKNLDYPTTSISNYKLKTDPVNVFFEISRKLMGAFSNINHNFFFYNNLEFLKRFKDYKQNIKVKVQNKIIDGVFDSVNEKGELILRVKKQKKKINFGDVI
jgi:BirA family biotin operon repressor/biotin-[acetyl-CoA-carboxylase] ligase